MVGWSGVPAVDPTWYVAYMHRRKADRKVNLGPRTTPRIILGSGYQWQI